MSESAKDGEDTGDNDGLPEQTEAADEQLATEHFDTGGADIADATVASAVARPDELPASVEQTDPSATQPTVTPVAGTPALHPGAAPPSPDGPEVAPSEPVASRRKRPGWLSFVTRHPLLTAGVLVLWAGALAGGTLLGGWQSTDGSGSGKDGSNEAPSETDDVRSPAATTDRTTTTAGNRGSAPPATTTVPPNEDDEHAEPTTTTSSSTTTTSTSTTTTIDRPPRPTTTERTTTTELPPTTDP